MLLHGRDLKRGVPSAQLPLPYANLGYLQKKQLAQHIAHEMVENERSAISLTEATTLIRTQLPTFHHSKTEDAEVITETLVERGGLLRARRTDAVEFVHNTLKEYLAAEGFTTGLMDNLVKQALKATGQDEVTWHNVAVFAAAIGSADVATSLIERLLAAEVSARQDRRRLILVLRCISAATQVAGGLRSRQAELEAQLFPPQNFGEASRLAEVGDHVVRFLRPTPGARLKAGQIAACVRALRMIGTTTARHALQGFLHYRQKRVVAELAQAVNPLEIEAVMAELKSTGELPDEMRRYVSDLEPLIQHTDIQRLSLDSTSVSDISALANLTNLQLLDLDSTSVSDVSALANLTNLRTLYLNSTSVSDISALANLTNLQTLYLSSTLVSDVSALANLTNLQTLYLNSTSVSDVSALANLANLQLLYLASTPVSDISALANLT